MYFARPIYDYDCFDIVSMAAKLIKKRINITHFEMSQYLTAHDIDSKSQHTFNDNVRQTYIEQCIVRTNNQTKIMYIADTI